MIYLDNNATTKIDDAVKSEMEKFFVNYYNPSSIYSPAQEVRKEIEKAREKVAEFLNANLEEIIFTGSGTESDNLAIKGIAYSKKSKGNHIITTKIEHPAVLNTCKYLEKNGFRITYLSVDKYGVIDLEELKKSISKNTILVSIMHANNEIGTIQDIKEISKIVKEKDKNIIFHTDAVQTAGKLKIDVKELGVDLLTISAHKFYGPKGVGALFIRKGVRIQPLIHGGHQERNLRGGTENVLGIIGMGKAAEITNEFLKDNKNIEKIKYLRDKLEKGILERIPDVIVNGHREKRVCNTLNVSIKGIEGESVLIYLDFEKIYASTGSACASGSIEPSHVLLAIGLPHEIAHGSIRFSLSKYNTEEEIDKTLEVLPGVVEKLRKVSPFK